MKVRVKNLSIDVTKKDLEELFKPYFQHIIDHTAIDLKEYREEKKKFAFINIPDVQKAEKAIKELNEREFKGKKIRVTKYEPDKNQSDEVQQEKESSIYFPYSFVKRAESKKPLEEFHDMLLGANYDIAFEITWRAITPIALNPCFNEAIPETPFPENKDDYKGYNRRWLTIDNHLAISPFTVKSAIANGFANILGGCYRVNTKVEKDREYGKGQYIYPGAYKRYRVARDGSSKPGIIKEIEKLENGNRKIKVIPVEEYHLEGDLQGKKLKMGEEVYVKVLKKRGHLPALIKFCEKNSKDGFVVKFHGLNTIGMDCKVHKKYRFRFYKEKLGILLFGTIPSINFLSKDGLKEKVCIGGPEPESEKKTEWHQDLSDLKKGDFIYYEAFNNRITHIGKNFLFKALFYHEDAVPENQKECKNLDASLCPRCRMFGLTDKSETANEKEKAHIGYRGRFRSATLVSKVKIKEEKEFIKEYKFLPQQRITLKEWLDEGGATIARQVLLPIQGPPKPNKRDVDGYFDKTTGEIKGAKVYIHSMLKDAENINNVNNKDKNKEDYSHELRNFAQVVKEGTGFTGVVGAENATIEEISALLILLNTDFSDHGFKLGLGKAFGLGSIHSTVNRVWIRKKKDYDVWQKIEIQQDQLKDGTFLDALGAYIERIKDECKRLKDTVNKSTLMINRIGKMENKTPLVYPEVVVKGDEKGRNIKGKNRDKDKKIGEKRQDYWKVANMTMIK